MDKNIKKYMVTIFYSGALEITISSDTKEQAIKAAMDAYIDTEKPIDIDHVSVDDADLLEEEDAYTE